jgi:hypothetical protein
MDVDDSQWLHDNIIELMITIDSCLNYTTCANDRYIYTNDIATVSRWLIKLYQGEPVIDICHEILSNKTNKYFGEYWRYGPWGESEAIAIATLQKQIIDRFNLAE